MTGHSDGVDTVAWLLQSDPAIRWQAMRDLTACFPGGDRGGARQGLARRARRKKYSPVRSRTARGADLMHRSGCRPSSRCSSCARPASSLTNLLSRRR